MDDASPAERPDDSVIKFSCAECGQHISVPITHAGKKGKCPKCKNIVIIPKPETKVTAPSETGCSNVTDSDIDSILDMPQKDRRQPSGTLSEEVQKLKKSLGMEEEAEAVGTRKLPWLIDMFLYPLNLAGVIHLIGLWLLVFLLCPLIMELWGLGIEYIPIVYTLPIAYVLYYFTECIRDSAAGSCRVPDFWMHPADSDKWDCISQLLVVLGSIAVCFWPVSVYYIIKERTDLIYWLLMACGGFFFPMVLLAAVLFDSYNAFNPILIIGSIFRTFFPYCGMVLLFYGGALLFMKIDSHLYSFPLLPAVTFIPRVLQLYLMFVAVGLLGRFYRRYRDRLNWEV